MKNRVVVTGMGVCAPNGLGLQEFTKSLQEGKSGIRFHQELEDLKFSCQIAGKPNISQYHINKYFSPLQQRGLNASGIVYGVIAGMDAWKHAGLAIASKETPDWDSGIIFGTGILGVDKFRESIHLIDEGNTPAD
jgi:3-oxoacyl-[acyl-carrier-protein] synthase-1